MVSLVALVIAATPAVGPTPSWVVSVEYPFTSTAEGAWVGLLTDRQVRVASTVETYARDAWLVRTLDGVSALATQEFEWDPAWQSLTIHGIWVWRDGKRRGAWHPEDARVLEHQSLRDERIYDGRLTYRVELRDLRVGDVIEVASTRTGENPLMKGHYATRLSLASPRPLEVLSLSVTWARPRALAMRLIAGAPAPLEQRADTVRWSWLRTHPEVTFEPHLPPDLEVWPAVEFSDWADWHDVALWANRLFTSASAIIDERTRAEVARLEKLPHEQRLAALVRFVQDDIRYVGVELGPHSHQPHPPGWVLERGFGDCKDKALLMVALLKGLGLRAQPVLVSSDGIGTTAPLPSPFAFDHAIVRAELGNGPRFIDGTEQNRLGDPAQWEIPTLGQVLIVEASTTALTTVASSAAPATPDLRRTQRWIEPDGSGLATFELSTVVSGENAGALRSEVRNQPRADLQKSRLRQRERDFGQKLEPLGVEVSEEAQVGAVTLTERYGVLTLKLAGERHLQTLDIGDELWLAPEPTRTLPFAVRHPRHLHETVIYQSQSNLDPKRFTLTNKTFTTPAYTLKLEQKIEGRTLTLDWDYVTLRDRITPLEWPAYRGTTTDAVAALGYGIENRVQPTRPDEAEDAWPTYLCGAVAVVGLMGLVLTERIDRPGLMAWFRRRRFRRKHAASPGETASLAQPVDTIEAARALFRATCQRGHAWNEALEVADTVRLGDERITVVRRRCGTCSMTEVRYVKLP